MTRSTSAIVLSSLIFALPLCSVARGAVNDVTSNFQQEIGEIKGLVKELLHKIEQLEASLGQVETPKAPVMSVELLGLELKPVSRKELRKTNNRYNGGMKIVGVKSGGVAAEAGIRVGDILVGLHRWETVSRENVEYILAKNWPILTISIKLGSDVEPAVTVIQRHGNAYFSH